MANVTITRSDLFPNGTVVKIYARNALHLGQQGPPSGGQAATQQTMTSGTLTFEGLSAGQEYTAYAEVGGADALLAVQAPASVVTPVATGTWEPQEQSLLGWNFDPVLASGTFQPATDGLLYVVRVPVREQVTIKNVLFDVTTVGATLTASQNLVGVFAEGSRKKQAEVVPATVLTAFETLGLATLALNANVVAGPGYVLVGIVARGTTKPKLAAGGLATAGVINAGVSGNASRFATGDTVTTALPEPITSPMVASASPVWVGLS